MSDDSDPLYPMTVDEFAVEIDRAMNVMRARKEIGSKTSQYFVAKVLAEKLWQAKVKPMKQPSTQHGSPLGHLQQKHLPDEVR